MREYVILNSQKARIDDKFYTYEEVIDKPHIGKVIPIGYVMIDFDRQQEAEVFEKIVEGLNLKTLRINTTRGKHFIFKIVDEEFNNWNHRYTYIGLECDAKGIGLKQYNKLCYECIRLNNINRETKYYGNINNLDNVDLLPKWLYSNKSCENLMLEEGSRNDLLSKQQFILKKSGFTNDECKYITKEIINKYVLLKPLSDNEIDTICRDETYNKFKEVNKKFLIDDVVNNILNKEEVFRYEDKLLWYINNKYTSDEDYTIPGYITTFTYNLLPQTINNIMLKLKQSQKIKFKEPNKNYIVCKDNKLYDILSGNLIDNTPDVFSIIDYNYNYQLNASNTISEHNESTIKDFIYYCSCDRDGNYSDEKKQQILEMIGNCLIPNKSLNRCYFIKGNGANGKSKLKTLIEILTTRHNSFVSVHDFNSDFKRASMFSPEITCNLQDDFSEEIIKDIETFKSIITGSNMIVNPKYGRSSTKQCGATLVICTNEWPKFKTEDDAINRRLMFIELENTPKNVNINLEDDIKRDYQGQEWLFSVSLDAISNAFKRGYLIETEKSLQMKDRRILEVDDFVEYLFVNYYKGKDLIYDEDNNICNNDYENIDLPLKSTEEFKNEYYLYKGIDNISFMMSSKKIGLKIKKYLGKWYENKVIWTGEGSKRLWIKK